MNRSNYFYIYQKDRIREISSPLYLLVHEQYQVESLESVISVAKVEKYSSDYVQSPQHGI